MVTCSIIGDKGTGLDIMMDYCVAEKGIKEENWESAVLGSKLQDIKWK